MTCVPDSDLFLLEDLVATVVTDAEWGELTLWLVDGGDQTRDRFEPTAA